jgi:predicted MFS family arabinose efflux permease
MDMSQGVLQTFFMETVSQQHRGLTNSSYQAAFLVAWACGAQIGGLIIAYQGYAPVFVGAVILYSLALAVIWLRFGRKNDNNPPPELRAGFSQALSQ